MTAAGAVAPTDAEQAWLSWLAASAAPADMLAAGLDAFTGWLRPLAPPLLATRAQLLYMLGHHPTVRFVVVVVSAG